MASQIELITRRSEVRILPPLLKTFKASHSWLAFFVSSVDLGIPLFSAENKGSRGSVGSEYFRYDELPANLVRLREHKAYLSRIITHRFGPDDVRHAFELLFAGETGKVIIEQ